VGEIKQRMNSASQGARKRGDEKLEKDAEGRGKSRRRDCGIYSRRESSETPAPAPCPIRRLLNLEGQISRMRLYNKASS
jgi:hypothetical protein